MSDDGITLSTGGPAFFIWLVASVILWLHPESIPTWVIDVCQIVFWAGLILLGIAGIIVLIAILFAWLG